MLETTPYHDSTFWPGTLDILSDFDSTLAESGPDDEITEDDFKEAQGSGKDTAPCPDNIRYSDIKNLTEEDRTELHAIYQKTGHTVS